MCQCYGSVNFWATSDMYMDVFGGEDSCTGREHAVAKTINGSAMEGPCATALGVTRIFMVSVINSNLYAKGKLYGEEPPIIYNSDTRTCIYMLFIPMQAIFETFFIFID